jgi:type I restriction enzyme, S subunit
MTPTEFLSNFGHLADAPNGVEKLRGIIFELACDGRLVPCEQDNNRYDYITQLSEVAVFIMGQAPPGSACNKDGKGTIFVKTGEFGPMYPEVREWTTEPKKFAQKGDVLICVVGATVGKLNLAIDCAIGRSVAAVRPNDGLDTRFLHFSLMPFTMRLRQRSRGSAQGVIGRKELSQVTIRVPPLSEQHRIVAKVDKLTALCDELEQRRDTATKTRRQFQVAALDRLTNAETPEELETAWTRVRDNFASVAADPEGVKSLRQAILQLAVMGRLVPQDPNEKSLATSSTHKAVVNENKGNMPFCLPKSWYWSCLGELTTHITSGSRGWKKYYSSSGAVFIRSQDIKYDRLEFDEKAYVKLPGDVEGSRTRVFCGDLLLTITGANTGKAAIIDNDIGEGYVSQHVALVRFIDPAFAPFIHKWLVGSYGGRRLLLKESYGIRSGLNLENIRQLLTPVPPLSEQRRIVDKVDELMEFCDELEKNIEDAETTAISYANAACASITEIDAAA